MCDEYDDERMRAFWRAIAAARAADLVDIEREDEGPVIQPILVDPAAPAKPRAKALTR